MDSQTNSETLKRAGNEKYFCLPYRFQALWRYRYQVWIRLEDGAQGLLRVSQALNIDYTLPDTSMIGKVTVDCPDAPWLPPKQIKIEEVALSQEEQVGQGFCRVIG